jgi:hypothetical protein
MMSKAIPSAQYKRVLKASPLLLNFDSSDTELFACFV